MTDAELAAIRQCIDSGLGLTNERARMLLQALEEAREVIGQANDALERWTMEYDAEADKRAVERLDGIIGPYADRN